MFVVNLSSIAHMLQEKQAHWDNMVFIRYFNFASLQASGIDGLFLFLNMGTWHEGKGISNWVYKQYMGENGSITWILLIELRLRIWATNKETGLGIWNIC